MAAAVIIRDAILDRLSALGGYTTKRKTPVPQLQPEQLPALSVFVLAGRAAPDGDENAGEVRLIWDETIGISVARGFADTATLEGQIQAEVDAILNALLTDPTFVRFPGPRAKPQGETWSAGDAIYWDISAKRATTVAQNNLRMGTALTAAAATANTGQVDALFEGVMGATRRWMFPQDGETYFAELRLEITFRTRADYPPVITDDFELLRVTTAFPAGGSADQVAATPQIVRSYDIPQD